MRMHVRFLLHLMLFLQFLSGPPDRHAGVWRRHPRNPTPWEKNICLLGLRTNAAKNPMYVYGLRLRTASSLQEGLQAYCELFVLTAYLRKPL